MTNQEVITRARDLIFDTVATYRHDNKKLCRYLSDGIRALVGRRPESMFTGDDVTTTAPVEVETGDLSSDLQVLAQYGEDLAQFVGFRVFSEDTEDTGNLKRAMALQPWFARGT